MLLCRGLSSLVLLMWVVAQPAALAAPAQSADTVATPTLFSPIARSMQQLIGDGYQVVNIAVGLADFGYLLKRTTNTLPVQCSLTRRTPTCSGPSAGTLMLLGIDPVKFAAQIASPILSLLIGQAEPNAVLLTRGLNVGVQEGAGLTGTVGYLA